MIKLIMILQLTLNYNPDFTSIDSILNSVNWAISEQSCKDAPNQLGNLECIWICNQQREWMDENDILTILPECKGNLN